MIRALCSRDRSRLSPRWLIGSSLILVTATFALTWAGAPDFYAIAGVYAAFPMAMLIADSRTRRERPTSLLFSLPLVYLAMLGIAWLSEVL